MRHFLAALSTLALLSLPASAGLDDAWAAYRAGAYGQALTLFRATRTAEGYSGACRTGLVIGGFFERGEQAVRSLHQALDDCREAVKLDPAQRDARVSYAIALGYEAKRLKKPSYAKASRARLEALLDEFPDYAILHAALGGWHTEVSETGFLARLALGAKRSVAREHFEKAIALAPRHVGVRFEFIRFLARGDKGERKEAIAEINRLAALGPSDSFDAFLRDRALTLKTALEGGDKDAVKQALAAATAFADIRAWQDPAPYPLDED